MCKSNIYNSNEDTIITKGIVHRILDCYIEDSVSLNDKWTDCLLHLKLKNCWWNLASKPFKSWFYKYSIQDPNLVISVPAEVLAPHSARPSAGRVLTANLDMFITKFLRLSTIPYHFCGPDQIIQNDQQDLTYTKTKMIQVK